MIDKIGNNFLRQLVFDLIKKISKSKTKLPYKTTVLQVGDDVCEQYEIPEEDMAQILKQVNPINYADPLTPEKKMLCFLTRKVFYAKEFKVIWTNGVNCLVTPWFSTTGSTYESCVSYEQDN